jgi:hypothetical protein
MRRLLPALLLVMSGLNTAHSDQSDVTIVGGLDFGFKKLKLDTGDDQGRDLRNTFITLSPNIGVAYKSFYATASVEQSIQSPTQVGTEGNGTTANLQEFSRSESTLSFGYRLAPSFSVFGGFTKTGIDVVETTTESNNLKAKQITYVEHGPFVGASYNKSFGDKGTLAVSVAYAALDSRIKFVDHPGGVDLEQTQDGDNTGLSYGLTWSGSLTGSLGYRLGLKAVRYEMESALGLEERYVNFFFGISNYF